MSFNRLRRKRDPFGPRFGELMGKHCHAALTAAARGRREEFDSLIKDLYQMLDTIEQETTWPLEEYTKAKEEKDEPTTVAPESKPAPKRARSKSPAKKRTKKATKLSDGYGDND